MSLRIKAVIVAVVAVLGVSAGAIAIDYATSSPGLPVTVKPGVSPQRDPELVAKTVLDRLGPTAEIKQMTVVASDAEIKSVEKNGSALVPGIEPSGPVWVVRANGPFVGRRGPPGNPDITSSTGYYVIDDKTGEIIEMGLP